MTPFSLRFAAATLLLLQPVLAQTPPSPQPPDSTQIPAIHADTLAGEHVSLPADLHGKSAILVLGFAKDARTQVSDWGKRLATDYFTSSTVLFYEMPVIAGVPRLLRGLVLRQIAAEVSDRGKHHFLPIPDNEPRWRALAHVTDPNQAYLLLVSSTGKVQWTTSGPLTPAAYQAVIAHLPAPQK